jgi:hypothetical protein
MGSGSVSSGCAARRLAVRCGVWLLLAGMAESTASRGLTAIGLRGGGATARRASAAARVADLTQQDTQLSSCQDYTMMMPSRAKTYGQHVRCKCKSERAGLSGLLPLVLRAGVLECLGPATCIP